MLKPSENLAILLEHRNPEWIPFTLDVGACQGFTEPVMRQFKAKTGSDDPAEYFDFRTLSVGAKFGGPDPRKLHRHVEPGTTFDEWGIGHLAAGAEATYEKIYPPLAHAETVREVELLPIPILNNDTSIETIAEYRKRGYPVFGYAGSVYEWSWWLRGMEQFMTDLVTQPAIAQAIVTKVGLYTKKLALTSARLGIDVLCFYDDAGMQTGMQVSPELWRRFIKPMWKDILGAVHGKYPATKCFLHSCGNITEIIPDIVELGFDILHPLQTECVNVEDVKGKFGKSIALCATISAQQVFPFGKPEDVRNEVRRLKRVCGYDKRCILCPSNFIQPETPWENIMAFAEEAKAGR